MNHHLTSNRAGGSLRLAEWLVEANRLMSRAAAEWSQQCRRHGWAPEEPLCDREAFHRGVRLRLDSLLPAFRWTHRPDRDVAAAFALDPARVTAAAKSYLYERRECLAAICDNRLRLEA
jgi:hypothetical protein